MSSNKAKEVDDPEMDESKKDLLLSDDGNGSTADEAAALQEEGAAGEEASASAEMNDEKGNRNNGSLSAEGNTAASETASETETANGSSTEADTADESSTESEAAEPSEDDNAFAIIEGKGGVEVVCEVPELSLAKLPVGSVLNVQSYQNGAFTEAEVVSVEEEPSAYSADPWRANPNSSMYKLHAKLKDSSEFVIGNGVSVTLPQTQDDSGKSKSVYLPIHYVRQEAGDYYVMKADENDRLVKQYVSVGQILWGYYIEVTGGLDVKNDRICFPFGTDVKEGVKTQESTEVLYPSNY